MIKSMLSTLAAAGLIATSLAVPGAAAPQDGQSAQDKINELETQGFRVIVTQFGNAPLDQCAVSAVRPGYDVYKRVTVPGSTQGTVRMVDYTTIYLDANC